jgi:hypothetical protein
MKFSLLLLAALLASSCASTMEVKQQKYATLQTKRTFEFPFPKVWRGVEVALEGNTVAEKDPSDVSPKELERIEERRIKTDWAYDKSRDKYVEYTVNGFPRKQYLNVRYRYDIVSRKVLGGTEVIVGFEEEVEELDPQGNPRGYYSATKIDSSRPNELLKKIHLSILGQ